jgi:hypothetical protein
MANELVLVSSRPDARDTKHPSPDELGIELEAMSTIGRALEAIEDIALRRRILNWAVERWGVDRFRSSSVEPQASHAAIPLANDPALAVDSIGELFVTHARASAAPQGQGPAGKAPVESMLQSLAEDFQRLADEWNGDAKT